MSVVLTLMGIGIAISFALDKNEDKSEQPEPVPGPRSISPFENSTSKAVVRFALHKWPRMSAPSPKCTHDYGDNYHLVPHDKNNLDGRCCCYCYENWVKDHHRVPRIIIESLQRWVEHGIEPGGFLMTVLMDAPFGIVAGRADEINALNLVKIYRYILNECPHECWGSSTKVLAWKEKKQEERESLQQVGEESK